MKKTFFAILDSVTNSLKHYLSTVPNVNSSEMIKEFDKGSTKWYNYWNLSEHGGEVSVFQDLYFLSRCFREFNIVRRHVPKNSCKYIVSYVGDSHVQNITKVLLSNGGKLIKEIRIENPNEEGYQCLDLGIISPMFSNEDYEELFVIS